MCLWHTTVSTPSYKLTLSKLQQSRQVDHASACMYICYPCNSSCVFDGEKCALTDTVVPAGAAWLL